MTGDPETPPYDPETGAPGYIADETKWIEGDHPTDNPDGVTNSNHDYTPKTQEEKAKLLGVQMAENANFEDEEYPSGNTNEAIINVLARVRSPQDRVQSDEWNTTIEKNLAAGGSVEGSNPGPTAADQQRDEGSPGTLPGGGTV